MPQIGEPRVNPNNPNEVATWDGHRWVITARPGYDGAAGSKKYNDTLATWRAKSDVKRLDEAQQIEQQAYSNAATADRAREVLNDSTPTGPMAGTRIALGKALPDWVSGPAPFVPNKRETANLETIQTLGNQGTLGSVGQLKGPLSDRDVQFLKTLQFDPGASRQQNQRVLDAQAWVARRQAGYSAALRAWTERLGSPSAVNGAGESFDRWWGRYSATKIPPPGINPRVAGRGPAPRPAAPRPAPKARPAQPPARKPVKFLGVE